MGVRSALRGWLLADQVTEAAPAPQQTPERSGYEYGIPTGGLTEYRQGMGVSTGTDRRSMLTQLYEAYLACPWAWASINAIARTVTAGGLVTDWDNDDGEGDQDAPDKPENVLALERLFGFCNEREDIRQLMRGVLVDLLVFGDAYIEVVWMANIPVALYSLDSPSMFPIADEHGKISGYVQLTDFGQRAEFEPRDVIHISLDSPRSGVFGVSPTQANLLPITAWLFAAATCKEIFRKGNPPNIHVDFPASMGETQLNRWDAMYAARNIGPRNIGTPIITKGGATINELKQGALAEYLDFLSQKRDEILAGYGVPPAEAGVIESGNLGGGTGESQRKSFLMNTCNPIAELVLEKVNFHIAQQGFGIEGWHVKFAEVDMRDSEVIEKIRDMRVRNGIYVLNKARAEIGEPPVDGGNEAVLIDRQNLVLWRDIEALSQAGVAAKARGTSLDVGEPGTGKPVTMVKPEPAEVPDPLKGFAGVANQPGGPVPPEDDTKPDQKESVFAADWRRVSESWTRDYAARRRRALSELPEAVEVR